MRSFIFILSILFVLTGCTKENSVRHALSAKESMEAATHKEAVDYFTKANKALIHSHTYYSALGDIHMAYGHYVEAVNDYTRALRNSGKVEYNLMRGRAYMKLHIYRDAIIDFTNVVETKGSRMPVAYVERAMAFVAKGDFKRAMKDLKKAEKYSGESVEFDIAMGELYFKMGKYEQAKTFIQKAIIKDSKSAELYYLRARVFYKAKDAHQAISDLEKALSINSFNVEAKRMLAWVYATNPLEIYRNGQKALKLAKELFEINEDIEYIEVLAAAYAETGNFDMAVKTLEEGVRLTTDLVQKEDFRFDMKNYEEKRAVRAW